MANALQSISNDLAEVVSAAGLGVVRVEARRRLPASGIIWSSDGLIVTAHHVVEQTDNIRIGLPSGQVVSASIVGRDPTTDLALLRVQAGDLSAPEWADPGDVRVGHLVMALGRPGPNILATLGIVSALGEGWRTPLGGNVDRLLQTDVAMYPGFSGGPLVDASGRVLGPNTSAILRGLSLTVPTPTVRRVVETLLAHGRVRRGYLGVGAQPARLPDDIAKHLGQNIGLLLVSVEPDSPAGKAGLSLGDTIVAIDGHPVRRIEDLLSQLSGERVGQSAMVKFIRGGQIQEKQVVIATRGE